MRHDEIFRRLEPPPNGLASLRARIERREHAWRMRLPLALAGLALAALVVLIMSRRTDPVAAARRHVDAAEVSLGIAPMPTTPATIDDSARMTTALAEVKTSNPNVAFYWVSSTAWE